MILITTVFHSGTHSLIKDLALPAGEWIDKHCCPKAVEMAQSGRYEVHTTYRDPYRVAASWLNRDRLKDADYWFRQWGAYSQIVPMATVHKPVSRENTFSDVLGLHEALDRGDMDYYFKHVPKEWIDFVLTLPVGSHRA